ncbi:hypothetical protein SLS58_005362 [Diplodia intermedia]|uniref:3-hydroxyisobutyrate dehydrogenase n=1 Tax=Diplodia intermedia TaxID=856260 RepID=A0ABR3TQS6_9PEZI
MAESTTSTATEHGAFGFIGLGAMGTPMAANLRKKLPPSTPLYIHDANPAASHAFAAAHSAHGLIHIASSAKAVATHARTLISIVPAAPHVRAVYLDPATGVVGAPADASRLMLECSTIDVGTARAIGGALAAAGRGTYVDAPVSGGVPGAKAGTLSFLFGAEADAAFRARVDGVAGGMLGDPAKLFYLGGLGNGLAAKLANNYCAGVFNLVSAEALNFGIRAGVDKAELVRVILASTGASFMLEKVCPVPGVDPEAPSSRDYSGGFRMEMMPKDIGLAVQMAEGLGAKVETGRAALRVYEEAAGAEELRGRDASCVYRFLGGPE